MQSVHSWTDAWGLIPFLSYIHSQLYALNKGGWQTTTVLFRLSAAALHLVLHYFYGKL